MSTSWSAVRMRAAGVLLALGVRRKAAEMVVALAWVEALPRSPVAGEEDTYAR